MRNDNQKFTHESTELQSKEQEATEIDAINSEPVLASIKDGISERVNVLKEKAQFAQEKVSDNLSSAAEVVHQTSDETQEVLDKKSDKINQYAHQAIGKVNELGHRAGDALETSSNFVRKFDVAQSALQLKEKIRENPGVSLTVVGMFGIAFGILIGRARNSS